MRIFIAALLASTAAGCGGGSGIYLDTDVCEVLGFRQVSAKETQMSGGLMQAGTLEYTGSGDLKETFDEYVVSMKRQGWTIANVDIQGDRAVGTLRKDNRTCALEFARAESRIRAIIRVGTTR